MEFKLTDVGFLIRKPQLKWLMRAFVFLCCFTAFSFTPKEALSQNVTIKQEKMATVDEVFDLIMEQTELTFVYHVDLFINTPKVQLKKGTISVDKLLNKSLGTGKFNVVVSENNTIIIKDSKSQEPIQIVGKVVDEAGLPVSGATVLIKGTNIGVATDFDGSYAILVPNRENILVINALGFATQEIIVGNKTNINIVLKEEAGQLGEVVINAGYYKIKKKEQTGSISQITNNEIEKQPVNNPLEALQGRMTGVDIIQNSGVPGGGFQIRIRGQNSIMAGNEPLYVIDGVPYDSNSLSSGNTSGVIIPFANVSPLNAINPKSIESIEVLKDADATAIYGSRGANGVVLITTKKGKSGKARIAISSSTGIANIAKKMKLLNTSQYNEMREEAFANDGITDYPDDAYDINGAWDKNRYTDWQEELIGRDANLYNMQASISGGNEQTQFLITGDVHKETTVFPGDYQYSRTAFNSNLNHKDKNDRFSMSFITGYTLEKNNLPDLDFSFQARVLQPNAPALYDGEGNLNWENNTWTNPLAKLEASYEQKSKTLFSNIVLNYKLIKSINLKINSGYSFTNLEDFSVSPHTIYNPASGRDSSKSLIFTNDGNKDSWIIEPQIEWERSIGNHKLTALLGTSFQERNQNSIGFLGIGFANNQFIHNLSAANTLLSLEESKSNYKYHSIFTRLNYSFDDKLFINLTGRRDGSSRFGPDNRYGNFGAIGMAWLFSKNLKLSWLDFGKIRGSYGLSGNDQIGDYRYLQTYTISDYPYDGNIGLLPSRHYNPNFKWERNEKKEIGIESSFLKNLIDLSVVYYNNRSSNQLVDYPLPGTTGFTSIQSNLDALVENSGLEIELNSQIFRNNNFNWRAGFNISFQRNKLLKFPELENSTYANRYVIGQPLNIIKLYNLNGVNPDTGLFQFEDFNNDGQITSIEDSQIIADLSPKFFGGVSNNIVYKNWSLDFFLQFVKKDGYNQFRYSEPPGLMMNQTTDVLDRWQQPGDVSTMQRFTSGQDFSAIIAYYDFTRSTGIISDASFIRLKSASLSYNLKFGNTNDNFCRLYLQGQNLLTLTKFQGGDPEQIYGFLPPLRRLIFGVELQF